MGFYADDVMVGEVTNYLVGSGVRIFQIFQHGTEREHASFLLDKLGLGSGVVLDVGCGVGEVPRLMKEARPGLEFVLLNISQSQLELCPPFRKIHASVEDIPLPDCSVDAVMACYVLGHADKDKSLSEMRRVLKPGGVLLVVDITGGRIDALEYTAHDWDGDFPEGMNIESFGRMMPDFRERYPHIKPVIFRELKK